MNAFSEFYHKSFERLQRKAALYNADLSKEKQPLLRPFFENMADLNEGGKMLRGILVALGYQIACHVNDEAAEFDVSVSDDAALAFEVFQTGVLIHDDIIDHAVTRRGKPTLTVRYENSLKERGIVPPAGADPSADAGARAQLAASAAICAGDYLITASNQILAQAYRDHPQGAAVQAAFCGIILDTIRGELLDVVLPAEMRDRDRAKEDADALLEKAVNDIYHLKTARYSVIGPLHLGMLLGDLSEDAMAVVDRMADELGIAFQIKDDILGIYADQAELGKDIGSDIAEYKQTILYAYVRLNDPEAYARLETYYGKESVSASDLKAVQTIFEESGARAFAEGEMEKHFAEAGRQLEKAGFIRPEDREILKSFISYNRDRNR